MLKKASQPLTTSYFHETFKQKLSLTFDMLVLPGFTTLQAIFCLALCISQFQQCPSPPSPEQPWDICSRCQSRGLDIRNFIVAGRLGICVPLGRPPGIYIWHTCFWKYHGWVQRKRRGVCWAMACPSGTRKICCCFKGMFSQFWIFLHLLEIFNVKNRIN